MSDEKALLAAIWEHPHEDTPRLVYADWLQEHDQPERAEFIRAQIELARMDEDDSRRGGLLTRETALWKKHSKTWKAKLPKLLQAAPFRRGFPAPRRRTTIGSKFLQMTAADFEGAPLWDFRINSVEKHLERVFASDLMTRIEALEIPVDEIKKPALLATAKFKNMADLQIGSNWIGKAGVEALASNPMLNNLRALDLHGSDLTDAGISVLVAAPWFPSLRALELGSNKFREKGLRAIIGAEIGAETGALQRLGLRGVGVGGPDRRFGDKVLTELFRSPRLASLRELDLGINYIGPSGVKVLASEKTTLKLRALNLDNNDLGDSGVEALAAWPGLATVETLILSSNGIGNRGALALAKSPHLTRIKTLWLMYDPISKQPGAAQRALTDRFGDAVWFDYRYR